MKRMESFYKDSKERLTIRPISRALSSINGASAGQLLQPVAHVLSNRVSPQQLQPGDHIYSWRQAFSYAHHGIYIGNGKVIHFTRAEGQELTGTLLDKIASVDGSVPIHILIPCKECGDQTNNKGVVCTCMKCFLDKGSLYRYDYGKNTIKFLLNVRGGTCTLALSDPPDEVLHRAEYLLNNGFQCYNLFKSNCEDFAMYCKTGFFIVRRNVVGASGQATTVLGAPLAVVIASPVYIAGPLGMAMVMVGMYFLSRYLADVKNRPDASKISVEDLVTRLTSISKLPNQIPQ